MTPDLEATAAALKQLRQTTEDGIAIAAASDGNEVAVSAHYSAVSDRFSEHKTFTMIVEFDEAAGQYDVKYTRDLIATDIWAADRRAASFQVQRGYVVDRSSITIAAADGTERRVAFDSRVVQRPVFQILRDFGWQRRQGFWGRLLGSRFFPDQR